MRPTVPRGRGDCKAGDDINYHFPGPSLFLVTAYRSPGGWTRGCCHFWSHHARWGTRSKPHQKFFQDFFCSSAGLLTLLPSEAFWLETSPFHTLTPAVFSLRFQHLLLRWHRDPPPARSLSGNIPHGTMHPAGCFALVTVTSMTTETADKTQVPATLAETKRVR